MSLALDVADLVAIAGPRRFGLPRLRLAAGECAALFGPSGAGKSTVLRALLDPVVRARGRVELEGRDLADLDAASRRRMLRTKIAFVTQDAMAALDPLRTLGDQVAAAASVPSGEARTELTRLSAVDEEAFGARWPHAVSGGQAQRALFAVASLRRPLLVVADEPTANLDDASAARVAALLDELRHGGAAVLLATHDERLLQALGPTVYAPAGDAFVPSLVACRPWPDPCPQPPASAPTVLEAEALTVVVGGREVLSDLDLELRQGEVVAVLGPSGSGKSTLLSALVGRVPLARGRLRIPDRRNSVQRVPQDAGGSLTPGRTIGSLVREVATPAFDVDGAARALGLSSEILHRTAGAISGGERRRAALLRAFAVEPLVLLLDEPTASLDRDHAIRLLDAVFERVRRSAVAVLLVTHDEGLADAVAHRILRLALGRWQPR